MRRDLYEPDHEAFREVVQAYVKREVTPSQQRWEQEHIIDRAPAENSSMLVGAVVRAEPTLYAIAVGGTLM